MKIETYLNYYKLYYYSSNNKQVVWNAIRSLDVRAGRSRSLPEHFDNANSLPPRGGVDAALLRLYTSTRNPKAVDTFSFREVNDYDIHRIKFNLEQWIGMELVLKC